MHPQILVTILTNSDTSIYLQTLMLISKVCKQINEQLITANEFLTVMQEHT